MMQLYSEGTVASLLETAFFYQVTFPSVPFTFYFCIIMGLHLLSFLNQESCEVAGDSVLDLVDYCHRRLVALLARREGEEKGGVVQEMEEDDSEEKEKKQIEEVSHILLTFLPPISSLQQELLEQESTLTFSITMKSISLLHYITDHLDV